jgi:hypothetical protein
LRLPEIVAKGQGKRRQQGDGQGDTERIFRAEQYAGAQQAKCKCHSTGRRTTQAWRKRSPFYHCALPV